jgi:PAS domain S-box-containing protein
MMNTTLNFELLFESLPDLYLILSPDLTIRAVSDEYLKATLTVRKEIIGHNLFDIFPDNPEDQSADGVSNLRSSLNYVLHHRQQHIMPVQKYDVRRPDGVFETRYWSPKNTPILNARQEVEYIVHQVKNVTSEHLSLERVETQSKEFQYFFNSSYDLCGIANKDGYFEVVNSNFSKILGYPEEVLYKIPFIELIHPDDVAETLEVYDKLKAGAQLIHFVNRYRKQDMTYVDLDWNATPNPVTGKLYCVARDITESKKNQLALKESEEQIQTIFKNAPDAVVVFDEKGFIVKWNPRAETIFGWKEVEMIGRSLYETIFPESLREKQMHYLFNTAKGDIINRLVELIVIRKDHTAFTAGMSVSPTLVNGEPMFIGFVSDITERKNAERALNKLNAELEDRVKKRTDEIEKREKIFRKLIENNHDIILLVDKKFSVVYRSPSAAKITGWSDQEVLNQPVTNNIHPEDKAAANQMVSDLIAHPGSVINTLFRSRHKNGNYLWVEGTAINLLEDADIRAIVFNCQDITQQKELQDLLHKANALARIGGWEIDMVKGTVYWSDITREIHETEAGYVPDLTTGINFYKEGPGRELIQKKVSEAIDFGKSWDEELQIVTAKNNERWVRVIGEAEFKGDQCVRVYGSFQDIDQRKKAQLEVLELNDQLEQKVIQRTEELRKSIADLEAFSYSVSHDLRAPLRSILGYSAILAEDYASQLDDEARRVTGIITKNTLKMGQLVDDLLHFSKISRQDISKKSIDTNSMLNEIIESLSPPVAITWVIAPLPESRGDFNALRQVWTNLLSNAIKYSSKKEHPRIEIGSFTQLDATGFFVKDNGAGFDALYKDKLFKVFQRLHHAQEFEGTGVGLAIVDKIISKHGGKVWAEANLNQGAQFFFTLPNS